MVRAEEAPAQPPPADVDDGTPTVPFACPQCGESYAVSQELVGRVIACRGCRELGRVSAPPPAPPPPPPAPAPAPVAGPPAPPLRFRKGLVLGVVGGALLVAALVVHNDLNEKDAREEKLAAIADDITTALGNLRGEYRYRPREAKNSDRAPVYVLAALGAMFIGLGVVCWTIESQPAHRGRPPADG
jgi:OmpA-OmpF porin, OOP family